MLEDNPIKVGTRLKELIFDYLLILGYLLAILAVGALVFLVIFNGYPDFTAQQSQWMITFLTVVPIVIFFSVQDYRPPYGTFGKQKAGLTVHYKEHVYWRSLLRNGIKFLPWQLAHMGVISGIDSDFSTWISLALTSAGMVLALILLLMGLFRKDKRHLGDLLAGTQVVES